MTVMRLALLVMAATLFAGEKIAAPPQRIAVPIPRPTPAMVEVPKLEYPVYRTTASVVTQGKVEFERIVDDATGRRRVVLNPGAQVILETTDYSLSIEDQRDFNGDGIVDALISLYGGGTCCPPTYAFLTIYKGEAFVSALDEDGGWAGYSVSEERGYPVVAQKHLETTDYWRLKGTTAVKVGSRPKLKAFAEIYGFGPHYVGPEESATLKVDIDDDGIIDSITCGIWPRWGSLTGCELPVPGGGGQTLKYACDRLGALKRVRNGLHELVCNNDTVVYFDGTRWRSNEE